MRARLVLLAVLALILILPIFPAAAAAPGADTPPPALTLTDRDGDHLSDDLESTIEDAAATDRFDIVASFATPQDASAGLQRAGIRASRNLAIINGFAASATVAQIRGLARSAGVQRIDHDFQISITNDVANQDFGTERARATYGVTGQGIGVCIVDTGVDPGHEQTDKVVGWYDAVNGKPAPYDDQGHGTHVAATAAGDGVGSSSSAATYMGVAPAAPIYAAKVLDANGSGTESQVIAGVDWCAQQTGVQVISMSLGSTGSSDGGDNLSRAVDKAVTTYGKVAVVAAGNSGDTTYTVGSPGAAAQAITVGAVAEWGGTAGTANHSLGVYPTPWSSRGPTADGRTKPDVAAPGHTITSADAGTGTGYTTASGTSMATPFVSGTVALALSANPNLTPDQVRQALEGTALDWGPSGKDIDTGAGLIDGYAFISQVKGTTGQTAFPAYQRTTGSVADHGLWSWSVEITDTTVPLAVTITLDGQAVCTLWWGTCLIWEWDPDLDARLLDPSGNVVATSECPAYGDCAGAGRQETLHITPAATGTYTVQVYPYEGSPNNGKGGTFAVDVSSGPAGSVDSPPSVQLTSPADGTTISGIVSVAADASDDQAVSQVEFSYQADGGSFAIGSDIDGTDGWSVNWDTTALGDGPYGVTATATDTAGQTAGHTISVTVDNVDELPTVSITDPADGALLAGSVTVTATASDDWGVAQVDFSVDGSSIGIDSDGGDGWSLDWNTATSTDGTHQLTATAIDTAGQTAGHTISVTVDNTAPTIGNVAVGSITSGSASISWGTNEASDSLVEYGTTPGTYDQSAYQADQVLNHQVSLDGLSSGTTYYFRVSSTDAAGNTAVSSEHSFTTESQTVTSLHVGDLDGSSINNGSTWTAQVSILVLDGAGNPVADATVSGAWTNGTSGPASCITGSDGRCAVSKSDIRKRVSSVTYTVSSVSHASLTYDSAANTDPDGDSDGTSITIGKP